MLDCWSINPTDRPKAIEISNGLERWTPDLSSQAGPDPRNDARVRPHLTKTQIEVKCRGAGPGLRQRMNIN